MAEPHRKSGSFQVHVSYSFDRLVWGLLRNPAYRGLACFGKTRVSARARVMRP
jgi:hypothetical protein